MQHLRRLLSQPAERGQTLVLFALMSLTLIAGLGLVIDAGVNYAQRRNMQNAADTAALAGTRIVSRVNTFPGTTRQMVWNEVKETAVANGVANDASLFQCVFVDKTSVRMAVSCNTDVDGGGNLAIPLDANGISAAGVQVRVSETHGTFFMRALGIATSGTSAASKAQVRAMAFMPTRDIVFAVCGVETMTRSGSKSSILETEIVEDWTQPRPSPPASPIPKEIATKNTTAIRSSAYKFDWNSRDASGNLVWNAAAPTYQLYSPTVASCDAQSGTWYGAILQQAGQDVQMQPNGAERYAPAVKIQYGDTLSNNSLEHSINGTLGCKFGTLPSPLPGGVSEPRAANLATDGCIMILPVLDGGNDDKPRSNTIDLRGRVWGVFYVFNKGGRYYGWLIKNYPVHEDGEDSWTQNYVGPITIALTRVD